MYKCVYTRRTYTKDIQSGHIVRICALINCICRTMCSHKHTNTHTYKRDVFCVAAALASKGMHNEVWHAWQDLYAPKKLCLRSLTRLVLVVSSLRQIDL